MSGTSIIAKISMSLTLNFHALYRLLIFFFKNKLPKNYFRNTIRVSNSLVPDQVRHIVRPDPGLNCLQRLSADDTCR